MGADGSNGVASGGSGSVSVIRISEADDRNNQSDGRWQAFCLVEFFPDSVAGGLEILVDKRIIDDGEDI